MIPPEVLWLLPVFAGLLGLVLGSFVNVVIHRLPAGESTVTPRSRCPGCREVVAWYDNVPVLSYLLLFGRCRHCGMRISPRYPAIELVSGAAAVFSFLRHGPSLELAAELAFVLAVIALVFIDYDHQILPDVITLGGLGLGLALSWLRPTITPLEALGGASLGAGTLLAVSKVYFVLKKEEGMGLGDVKMMGMVGAFVGWKGVMLTLFLGSLLGSIVGVLLIALGGGHMKSKLPFGTFLGMGAIAVVYAGSPVIDWYASFY